MSLDWKAINGPRRKHVINLQHKQLVKTTQIIAFYCWLWRYESTLQWYNQPLHCVHSTWIDRTSPLNEGFHQLEERKIKKKSLSRKEMIKRNKIRSVLGVVEWHRGDERARLSSRLIQEKCLKRPWWGCCCYILLLMLSWGAYVVIVPQRYIGRELVARTNQELSSNLICKSRGL